MNDHVPLILQVGPTLHKHPQLIRGQSCTADIQCNCRWMSCTNANTVYLDMSSTAGDALRHAAV